jgi:hypothetical protein
MLLLSTIFAWRLKGPAWALDVAALMSFAPKFVKRRQASRMFQIATNCCFTSSRALQFRDGTEDAKFVSLVHASLHLGFHSSCRR